MYLIVIMRLKPKIKQGGTPSLKQQGTALLQLSNWGRIEERKLIVQSPVVRARLTATAGNIQNEAKNRLAHLLDVRIARSDRACINVDQIAPAVSQRRARRNLDHWRHR